MPDPALPVPRAADLGGCRLVRSYVDPLGRPMSGRVEIMGRSGGAVGGMTVVPVSVSVGLYGGQLDVMLPPDTYTVTGRLMTTDGDQATVTFVVTLPEDVHPSVSA